MSMKDKGSLGGWQCLKTLETGNMGKVVWDWRRRMSWGSEIVSLGRSAEALQLFENTGFSDW